MRITKYARLYQFFPFHRAIMWSSLVKIQYTELKLSCGNDPVVKKIIYSNGDLDLWPNDPKINRVLPLPQGNHVANFGKDPIYRTKVIVQKPVWTPAKPNHIIRPVLRRAYKNGWESYWRWGWLFYRDVQIHETFGGQQVQHNVQFWWTWLLFARPKVFVAAMFVDNLSPIRYRTN